MLDPKYQNQKRATPEGNVGGEGHSRPGLDTRVPVMKPCIGSDSSCGNSKKILLVTTLCDG